MKKTLFLVACAGMSLVQVSCDKEQEFHSTQLFYPFAARSLVYADQQEDSLVFETTESWLLTSNSSWCTVADYIAKVDNPYPNTLVIGKAPIFFTPNKSGDWRLAIVSINAGEYSAQAAYYQAPFLNVIRPARVNTQDGFPNKLSELTDSARWTTDSVTFRVFGHWTLESQSQRLTPEVTQGRAGLHTVRFSQPVNTTATDQTDTLLLVCEGVTDKIPVRQLAPKR